MTTTMYPNGQHPKWCDLSANDCNRDDPNHIGRTSHLFVQVAEARISLQLSRIDSTAPACNWTGDVKVRLTLNEGNRFAIAEMSTEEIETLALLCGSYVDMAKREDSSPIHAPVQEVLTLGGVG